MFRLVSTKATASLALFAAACSSPPPQEPPDLNPNATSEEGGSDEFGAANDEAGTDTSDETGGEISHNKCLTKKNPGFYGFRHHCGGKISFSFSGAADGVSVNRDYGFGFGPTYVETEFEDQDTYEQPMIAACCGGPYDFQQVSSSQKVYFENCKLDGAQQVCAAMDQWLIQLAEEYPAAKTKLYEAAETLGNSTTQTDCTLSLYEAGEVDGQGDPIAGKRYNEITDTSWNITVGNSTLTIEIDLLEILELDHPSPPDTCETITENDKNLLPLLTAMEDGTLGTFELDAGGATLDNSNNFSEPIALAEGYLSVAELRSGDTELRNILLRDPASLTIIINSTPYTVDSWNITLISPVTDTSSGGVTSFASGEATFALAVVYGGELYHATGTNVATFTLTETPSGWDIDGLELEFQDGATTWSFYNSSTLEFGP